MPRILISGASIAGPGTRAPARRPRLGGHRRRAGRRAARRGPEHRRPRGGARGAPPDRPRGRRPRRRHRRAGHRVRRRPGPGPRDASRPAGRTPAAPPPRWRSCAASCRGSCTSAPATAPSTSSATGSSGSTTTATASPSASTAGRTARSTWWSSPRGCAPAPATCVFPGGVDVRAPRHLHRLPHGAAHRERHRLVALVQRAAADAPSRLRPDNVGTTRAMLTFLSDVRGLADLDPADQARDPAPDVRRRRLGDPARARRAGRRRVLLRRRRPGPRRRRGAAGGWPWSATPPGAPRRSAAWAPAWRWSGRTCSPASWPPTATTAGRSRGTRRSCGPTSRGRRSCRPARPASPTPARGAASPPSTPPCGSPRACRGWVTGLVSPPADEIALPEYS